MRSRKCKSRRNPFFFFFLSSPHGHSYCSLLFGDANFDKMISEAEPLIASSFPFFPPPPPAGPPSVLSFLPGRRKVCSEGRRAKSIGSYARDLPFLPFFLPFSLYESGMDLLSTSFPPSHWRDRKGLRCWISFPHPSCWSIHLRSFPVAIFGAVEIGEKAEASQGAFFPFFLFFFSAHALSRAPFFLSSFLQLQQRRKVRNGSRRAGARPPSAFFPSFLPLFLSAPIFVVFPPCSRKPRYRKDVPIKMRSSSPFFSSLPPFRCPCPSYPPPSSSRMKAPVPFFFFPSPPSPIRSGPA